MSGSGPAKIHQALLSLARRGGGRLTFAQFMQIALYLPGSGYYPTHTVFGRDGDYQTAPRVHPLFGWTVAEEVRREWVRLGRPEPFTILELGPGEGDLVKGVVEGLSQTPVPLGELKVVLSDIAPRKDLYQELSEKVGLRWVRSLADLRPFKGVVLANELLDALPFHRFKFTGGRWMESYVVVGEEAGRYAWEDGEPSTASLLKGLPSPCAEGSMREVQEGLEPLLNSLGRALTDGTVIFFDYGDSTSQLLERYPEGTLETFRGHTLGTDPFSEVGDRDLTAWVDFSSLIRVAEETGFRVEEYLTQAEALYNWGLRSVVERMSGLDPVAAVKARMAMKTFLFGYTNHRVLKLRRERREVARRLSSRTR